MNSRIFLSLILLICLTAAFSGCTGAPQKSPVAPPAATPAEPASPGPVGSPAPAVTTANTDLVPGTEDILEPSRAVTVNIEKDYLGKIHATFQGGPGLIHVRKIEVTVNRPDGRVESAPLGIKVDDTAVLEGTKENDRVIVVVTLSDGKSYRIFDQIVAFKGR